jgi:hypothetical protein
MNKYVTTITIIHEAESQLIARQDSERIQRHIVVELAHMHVREEIGPVRNVSVFSVREKM